MADHDQARADLGKSGNLLCHDDRLWPGHWRNHDRPDGNGEYPHHGLEHLQWLSHVIGQYCRGNSRSPAWRYALSPLIPRGRALIRVYVSDQYRRGGSQTTIANEV